MADGTKPNDIPQGVFDLYDRYCHGDLSRRAFFDGLSYSNKRVFTLSIEGTNNPETKARRVEKAIALMREGRVR